MKLNEPLAAVLRNGRADFNARFAAARRARPALDAEAFGAFLVAAVDPMACAVARVRPEGVATVVDVAYDITLDLVGQQLAAPGARSLMVNRLWEQTLPAAAALVAQSPAQLLTSLNNSVLQLAATPGARPGQWLDLMQKGATCCDTPEVLLRFGQLAAWRSGLAHYRASALVVARDLPPTTALAALGVPPSLNWPAVRERLGGDPWFDPSAKSPASGLRVAGRAGTFRGFGGLFPEPPVVALAQGRLLVQSGSDCWHLTADCFGATFHRAASPDFDQGRQEPQLPAVLRMKGATVQRERESLDLPELGRFTSAACDGRTLALTSATTHAVVLVALV